MGIIGSYVVLDGHQWDLVGAGLGMFNGKFAQVTAMVLPSRLDVGDTDIVGLAVLRVADADTPALSITDSE